MSLKPQDILVLLKLIVLGDKSWSYNDLAYKLRMSPAEVHAALKRAIAAQLAHLESNKPKVLAAPLLKFLTYGIRHAFYVERGEPTIGMPTAHAASPLAEHFHQSETELPPVWPHPEGPVRGISFSPLYKSAPEAAKLDQDLYELLVLVDAIRGGRARERNIAVNELEKRLTNA